MSPRQQYAIFAEIRVRELHGQPREALEEKDTHAMDKRHRHPNFHENHVTMQASAKEGYYYCVVAKQKGRSKMLLGTFEAEAQKQTSWGALQRTRGQNRAPALKLGQESLRCRKFSGSEPRKANVCVPAQRRSAARWCPPPGKRRPPSPPLSRRLRVFEWCGTPPPLARPPHLPRHRKTFLVEGGGKKHE